MPSVFRGSRFVMKFSHNLVANLSINIEMPLVAFSLTGIRKKLRKFPAHITFLFPREISFNLLFKIDFAQIFSKFNPEVEHCEGKLRLNFLLPSSRMFKERMN